MPPENCDYQLIFWLAIGEARYVDGRKVIRKYYFPMENGIFAALGGPSAPTYGRITGTRPYAFCPYITTM